MKSEVFDRHKAEECDRLNLLAQDVSPKPPMKNL